MHSRAALTISYTIASPAFSTAFSATAAITAFATDGFKTIRSDSPALPSLSGRERSWVRAATSGYSSGSWKLR
jgi:hypothetical protein